MSRHLPNTGIPSDGPKTFGFIFECLRIRDLWAYSQALGGRLSYYHDRYNLGPGAVLQLSDGRDTLTEFKLES